MQGRRLFATARPAICSELPLIVGVRGIDEVDAWRRRAVAHDRRDAVGSSVGSPNIIAPSRWRDHQAAAAEVTVVHGVVLYLLPRPARKDFAPIGMIGNAPNSLVVHPSFPAKTVAELIAYAKENPGKVNFGSAGAGTASHITGEYFARSAGISLVHVPYKGFWITSAMVETNI